MEFDFDESNNENHLLRIKQAFYTLANDAGLQRLFPEIADTADKLRALEKNSDEDVKEIALLNLYCAIHGAGSNYSSQERLQLDGKNGYFNHPGGISPLLKADAFIRPDSIVADLGAGNGLQGLLFQYLYPHQLTIQIELSAEMIRIGQQFQRILKIPPERIAWVNDDIINVSLDTIDFLYLYRPSKPMKNGIKLYQTISRKLQDRKKALTIFSIADCLKDYLDNRFSIFYSDGHLTCFAKRGTPMKAGIEANN
ncbi:MAG: hypothetical protein ABIK68_15940 [bacterium]